MTFLILDAAKYPNIVIPPKFDRMMGRVLLPQAQRLKKGSIFAGGGSFSEQLLTFNIHDLRSKKKLLNHLRKKYFSDPGFRASKEFASTAVGKLFRWSAEVSGVRG